MPDATGTHSDGALIFGSQILTINSVAYIGENISVSLPTKMIESMNEVGVDNKTILIEKKFTGSATLQLASSATVSPSRGHTFSITPVGGGTARQCWVTEVGEAFTQDGETKVSINFVQKLN